MNDQEKQPMKFALLKKGTQNDVKEIHDCNRFLDQLRFPLLFPKGIFGWNDRLRLENHNRSRMTGRKYTASRIMMRVPEVMDLCSGVRNVRKEFFNIVLRYGFDVDCCWNILGIITW